MPQVIALGDINIDIIASFPSYPLPGEDALASSAEMHCGGSAANMAVILSRLGVGVGLIGRVGLDPWGDQAIRHLHDAGVDLQAVQRDPAALTGLMTIVVTPDGERTMLGHRGANVHTDPGLVGEEPFRQARWFHLSGYALLQEPQRSAALIALEQARRHRLRISLDPGLAGSPAALDRMRALLPAVDWILPNLAEAQALAREACPHACAARLRDLGAAAVALKMGADGCLVAAQEGGFELPGFAVSALDSTGAGDAFAAGLVGGLVGGLDLRASALLGTALGGLVASHLGAGRSALTRAEVKAFLQAHLGGREALVGAPTLERVLSWLEAAPGSREVPGRPPGDGRARRRKDER